MLNDKELEQIRMVIREELVRSSSLAFFDNIEPIELPPTPRYNKLLTD